MPSPMDIQMTKSQLILNIMDSDNVLWIRNNWVNVPSKFHWKTTGCSQERKFKFHELLDLPTGESSDNGHSSFILTGLYWQLANITLLEFTGFYYYHWNIWTFGNKKFRKKSKKKRIQSSLYDIHAWRNKFSGKWISLNGYRTNLNIIHFRISKVDLEKFKLSGSLTRSEVRLGNQQYSIIVTALYLFFLFSKINRIYNLDNMTKGNTTVKGKPVEKSNNNRGKVANVSTSLKSKSNKEGESNSDSESMDEADTTNSDITGIHNISMSLDKKLGTPRWEDYEIINTATPSVYHITAMIYDLSARHIAHPNHDMLVALFQGFDIDDTLLRKTLAQILDPNRTMLNEIWVTPDYYYEVEDWARNITDEQTDDRLEAYKVLGYFYALAIAATRMRWHIAGASDSDEIIKVIDQLGLQEATQTSLKARVNSQRDVTKQARMGQLDQLASQIFSLLDGIAETEGSKQLEVNEDTIAHLRNLMGEHTKACTTWSTVVKGAPKDSTTIKPILLSTTDVYRPLPGLETGVTAGYQTLAEVTTPAEKNKMKTAYLNQRGRAHLIPAVSLPEWPEDDTAELQLARNELLDKITTFDRTIIATRIVQIIGMKKPVITPQDEADGLSIKVKVERDIKDTLLAAGGLTLCQKWFDAKHSQIFQLDKVLQESIYVVLAHKEYFGTVGTYGTEQMDKAGRMKAFGNQGSGKVIHHMCQMIRSKHEYTEQRRDGNDRREPDRNYKQYWVIAMDNSNDPKKYFNAKTGPVICVVRGLHMEPEYHTELAVELLALRHWLRDNSIPDADNGLVLEQMMHTGRSYSTTGKYTPLQAGENEYYSKKNGKDYSIVRNSELYVTVRFAGGTLGHDGTLHPAYIGHKARITELYKTYGAYVNALGIRLEMFPTMHEMLAQRLHHPRASQPHRTYVTNVREHITARDIVEEMLVDRETNCKTIPNVTQVFYQPKAKTVRNQTVGARITFVWRDVPEPDVNTPEAAARYQEMTNHSLESDPIALKYASHAAGGATIAASEEDTRSRYVRIGLLYAATQISTNDDAMMSPPRKRANTKNTPERGIVPYTAYTTPSSSGQDSSISTVGSSGSITRYDPDSAVGALITRLVADVEGLRGQMATMCSSVNTIEARQTEADIRIQDITRQVQANSQLKPVLRAINQTANSLVSSRKRINLLAARITQMTGDTTEKAHELEMERTNEEELANTLKDLRKEAIDMAASENTMLSGEQLRSDV